MEQPRQPIQNEPTAAGSGRVNAVLLVGATLLASAVFAGVAEGEGFPVVLGAMLPWLALIAAAGWWTTSMRRARRSQDRMRAASLTRAHTAAVDILLADTTAPPRRLQAAKLVLAPEPTAEQAEPFLSTHRPAEGREAR